jgi:3-oxoacid CoA-transferase B subunit
MNVAVGVKRLIVMMEHTDHLDRPKILKNCTYPLTAAKCVKRIYTDMAVIDVTPEGLVLLETAPGFSYKEVQSLTDAPLLRSSTLKVMEF